MSENLTPSRASLFVTCTVDQFYPEIGESTVRLLRRLGVQVDFPADQTCCGQTAFNSGFWSDAKPLAKRFLDVFRDEPWRAWQRQHRPGTAAGLLSPGIASDRDGEMLELEADHRRHAEIENAIRGPQARCGVEADTAFAGRPCSATPWPRWSTVASYLNRVQSPHSSRAQWQSSNGMATLRPRSRCGSALEASPTRPCAGAAPGRRACSRVWYCNKPSYPVNSRPSM